jgi:HEAT repeat protein
MKAAAATPEILSRLAGLLGDKDEYVRGAATKAVGCIGVAAATPEILSQLARLLTQVTLLGENFKNFRGKIIDVGL